MENNSDAIIVDYATGAQAAISCPTYVKKSHDIVVSEVASWSSGFEGKDFFPLTQSECVIYLIPTKQKKIARSQHVMQHSPFWISGD